MQIKYNVSREKRKELVSIMRDILQETTRYLAAPTFCFMVGKYTVDKNGTVTCPDDANAAQIEMLIRELAHDGFIGERVGEATKPAEHIVAEPEQQKKERSHTAAPDRLAIELPKDGITPDAMENLRRLVASKATLLKKALATDSLPITEHADRIEFDWFRTTDDQAEISAYYQLVQGLCERARAQKRVSTTEREVENEKYAFRCFLLRLGFIGEKYKESRRILLKNLSGNAAFRDARESEEDT